MFKPPFTRRADHATMFVVTYEDGATTYVRVPDRDKRMPQKIVAERQERGEIPAGQVVTIRAAK